MTRVVRLRVLTNSRLGVRGAAMLTLGIFHIIYSVQQLFPNRAWLDRGDVQWRSEIVPSQVFGGLWALIGVMCIVAAFRKADSLGFGATTFLFMFWAMTELGAWIDHQAPQGYLSAATWATFGVLSLILSRIQDPVKISEYVATEQDIDRGDDA